MGPPDANGRSGSADVVENVSAREVGSVDNSNTKALAFLASQIPNVLSPALLGSFILRVFDERRVTETLNC